MIDEIKMRDTAMKLYEAKAKVERLRESNQQFELDNIALLWRIRTDIQAILQGQDDD